MLRPIETSVVHKEIQQQLKTYILERALRPGDRLPTENEIASQLQVSRTVVREALKGLEAISLVNIRRGSGIRVAAFDPYEYLANYSHSLIVEGVSFRDMLEVRRVLELGFIGQAARLCDANTLHEVQGLIAEMERALREENSTLLPGLHIHQVIYRCLGNELLDAYLEAFGELWHRLWEPIHAAVAHERLLQDIEYHRRLVRALTQADVGAARAALEDEFAFGLALVERIPRP